MEKKQRRHFDLKDIEEFLRFKRFPKNEISKGETPNFSRTCERFRTEIGQFLYKKGKVVVLEKVWQTKLSMIFMKVLVNLSNRKSWHRITAWKVSKYGIFSGPYFPGKFSTNTGKYGPEKTPYLDIFCAMYLEVFPRMMKWEHAFFVQYFQWRCCILKTMKEMNFIVVQFLSM